MASAATLRALDRLSEFDYPLSVELSLLECMLAGHTAVNRRVLAIKRSATAHRWGGWQAEIEGAAAELAVAKALGLYWAGAGIAGNDAAGGDVYGLQVRWTSREDGSLILHEPDQGDDPAAPFVLVTGSMPDYSLRGYLPAAGDGQEDRFWRTDRPVPAFFVPQTELWR